MSNSSTPTNAVDTRARRLEFRQRIADLHIPMARDNILRDELIRMVDHIAVARRCRRVEGCILAVVGESGTGKTWALERALAQALEPLGEKVLQVQAPSPCTSKELGRSLLAGLGYPPIRQRLTDSEIWAMARRQLASSGISVVWIDEAHHAMGRNDEKHLMFLRDTLKSMVQQRDWPIGLVVSGLPVVSDLVGGDRQVERRSRTMRFDELSFPAQGPLLHQIIARTVECAGMRLDAELLENDFLGRLCLAAEGCFGSAMALIKTAVLATADRAGADATMATVDRRDFAEAYRWERNCEDEQNVFSARHWTHIDPRGSRLRDGAPTLADIQQIQRRSTR